MYPTTPTSAPSAKALPNGDMHATTNGIANGENGVKAEAVEKPDIVEAKDEKPEASDLKTEVEQRVEDLKNDIISLAKEAGGKEIGRKGKKDEEKPVYPPNGYAHAPHWPMVRSFPVATRAVY